MDKLEALNNVRTVSESVRLTKKEQDVLQESLKVLEELVKKADIEKKK